MWTWKGTRVGEAELSAVLNAGFLKRSLAMPSGEQVKQKGLDRVAA